MSVSSSFTNALQGPDPLSGDEPARMFGDISDEERRNLVMQAYEHLKSTFERFKKPDGKKNYPGKTCRDIWAAYPDSPSGEYWVDPNEGDIRDAVMVHCDMENKATCVLPSPAKSDEIKIVSDKSEAWLGDIEGGIKVFAQNFNKSELHFFS